MLFEVSWLAPELYGYPDLVRFVTVQVKVPPLAFTGEVNTTCPLALVVSESVSETHPDQVMFTVTPASTAQAWSCAVMVASA